MIPPDDARTTSSARWVRVRAAVEGALALPPHAREGYLATVCGADDALRSEVSRLVAACETTDELPGFLGERAASLAAPIMAAVDAQRVSAGDAMLSALAAGLADTYAVEREIGTGGMATVFLARDRKHDRQVAIKVLRSELAASLGAERFLTEIRVTAGLQHPNLVPLFDSGELNGLLYYVMPFLNGESLRDRLERERQLPLEDAVRLTQNVAAALDYAHRHGVIHRDLKPANILLHDGEPLVADFGIALAMTNASADRVTHTGITVGTPQYMSPEQAAGARTIDARSDVYSLAAVLYEMLTGETPHLGASVQSVIAKVMSEEPRHVRVIRPAVPAHIDAAIHRALARQPADRFASAREFADALALPAHEHVVPPPPIRRLRRAWIAGAIALAAIILWYVYDSPRNTAPRTARFVVSSLSDAAREGTPLVTPDGTRIVYVGDAASGHAILVRRIDELGARPLPGTEGAISAFLSRDGREIGFFTSDDRLKIVPLDGGAARSVARVFRFSNARWGPRGDIVLDTYGSTGLTHVADSGGVLRQLTSTLTSEGESRHAAPLLTPDGSRVIFTVVRGQGGPGTVIGDLASAPYDPANAQPQPHRAVGVSGRQAVALVDGWLVYVATDAASLQAVRFNATTGRATGTPVSVLQDTSGAIEGVSLAGNGTLLYTRRRAGSTPVTVTTAGVTEPILGNLSGALMQPRFSPDGQRLSLQVSSPQGNDVWVYDIASHTPTRLTTSGSAQLPSWTPDGNALVYWSDEGGGGFWSVAADGRSPATRIIETTWGLAGSVAANGTLVFERRVDSTWGIWSAPREGDQVARAIVKDRADNYMPAISPDGKFLAFASNQGGRYEVHVQPFPGSGGAVQVSNDGGTEPVWSRDGTQLFYRGPRHLHSVTLDVAPRLTVRARSTLFADGFDGNMPHANYDVSPDGRQFVFIAPSAARAETVVILGWLDELRATLASAR